MTRSREHRRAAGSAVWPLVLAVVLLGCGGVHPRPSSGRPAKPATGPVHSGVALESLRMVTRRIGWAVAVDRNGDPAAVVRTIDGGRMWRDAGPPGLRGQGLRAAFYSAGDAWVTWNRPWRRAWPVTYHTTDGGRAWARMGPIPVAAIAPNPITVDASAPDMVSGQLGWVTAGLGVAGGSSGLAIFRTSDGGSRWQLVELTPGQGRPTPGAIPFGCDKGDAVFSSATTGWATGSCAGGRPTFWVSHDGGRTWRHQPLPQPSGNGTLTSCQCGLTGPIFTSPQDGAVWVGDLPGPPAQAAAVYLTHNGGRAWTPIHLPGGRVPLQTPDFVSAQHGYVTGGRLNKDGQITGDVRLYATTDGGATWASRPASPLLGQATLAGQVTLDFVTPAVGFASLISYNPLRSYLLKTRSGGATWTGVPARLARVPARLAGVSLARSPGPSLSTPPSPSPNC